MKLEKNLNKKIIFYGAPWCIDCRISKSLLDEHEIDYEYIDLELVPEAAHVVRKLNSGMQSIPTIIFPDGSVLVEPSDEELAEKLNLN